MADGKFYDAKDCEGEVKELEGIVSEVRRKARFWGG